MTSYNPTLSLKAFSAFSLTTFNFFEQKQHLTLNKKQKLTAAYEALSRADTDTDSSSRPI
ncbi:MAG: hypothetical protein WAQ29_05005 [Nitrososphaeraceae archaeon]